MTLLDSVPKELRPLLPRLVETANTLLDEVLEAHSSGNTEQARRAAHSLKGVGMSFNIIPLRDAAEQLQLAIATADNRAIEQLNHIRIMLHGMENDLSKAS